MDGNSLYLRADRLVDGTGASPVDDGAVLMSDGQLLEVGPSASVTRPERAEVVEFDNCTVLPGLVDCHTHLTFRGDGSSLEETMGDSDEVMVLLGARNASRALHAGVTTLCDNGGRGSTTFSIKEAIGREYVVGPRVLLSGRPITVTGGHCWPLGGEADGVDAVRTAVRQLVKEGADWIKVMATGGGTKGTVGHQASYTLDELCAIVEEAHSFDRWVGAHCTGLAAMERLLDAGVDMIYHGNFRNSSGDYQFDEEIAARWADTGTWFNPTLHVCRGRIQRLRSLDEERGLTDEERTYLGQQEAYWGMLTDAFQRMLRAGVPIVAGSDSGWSYYPFGHFAQEIDAMASVGMTPQEALEAATRLSAEAIGLGDSIGTLEPGKAADLLVVEGDPCEDPQVLTQVVAVYKGGRRVE